MSHQANRYLRAISFHKTFWLDLLAESATERAVPFPPNQRLESFDIPRMKEFAFQALRFDKNWSRPVPKIVGSIHCADLEGDYFGFTGILGTPLIFAIRPGKFSMIACCWNLEEILPELVSSVETGTVPGSFNFVSEPELTSEGCTIYVCVSSRQVDTGSIIMY